MAAVLAAASIGVVGLMGWSALKFHSVDIFSSNSSRLTFCGRVYEPEGVASRQLLALSTGKEPYVMGVTPSGSAILGNGCETSLWVRSSGPTYQAYDMLGGP